MKFNFDKYSLINLTTLALVIKVYLVFVLSIKSKYLFLNLVSESLSPTCGSGNICKQGESKKTSPGAIDNYNVVVLPGCPMTPIISPLLILLWTYSKERSPL